MSITVRRTDALYWLLSWLAVAIHLSLFISPAPPSWLLLYQGVLTGTYALLFLAPAWLLSRLLDRFSTRAGVLASVLLVALLQLLLLGDRMIWQLYGFHFNGFVWNILTTAGGIEALGASAATERDVAVLVLAMLALQGALRWLASRLAAWGMPAPRWLWVVPLLLVATLGERLSYGLSHFYGYSPLLETAQRMPFYQPLTLRRVLEQRFGLERPQRLEIAGTRLEGQLRYPQAPLRLEAPARPLNIVWLVAESWRADSLNPRVMPQTHAFARRAQQFVNHFSGGNGTRIGLFSQFYSLPANLWFPVLDARIGSPLIEVLQRQNYQLRLFTSARFSYPEFDKTLFVDVPPEQRIEDSEGATWARDRRNVDRLLQFIAERDPARPFMSFLFFESPHADYNFPAESVIEADYLREFSYARMDLARDIEGIRKRYLNAVHHLDSQLARVTDYLTREGLLDNTLVVITGDHGEEFMEHGRWGHNSSFVDAQLRVPLVLWVPGRAPHQEALRTSHADLLPTLLPLLGVNNPARDYGIGQSLFAPTPDRLLLAGDWSHLAFLGEQSKLVLPFGSGSFSALQLTHADDRTPLDPDTWLAVKLPRVQAQMATLRRFLAH